MPPLTDWFEHDVAPARPGVYEVLGIGYRYYDGEYWYFSAGAQTPRDALEQFQRVGVRGAPARPWRGIEGPDDGPEFGDGPEFAGWAERAGIIWREPKESIGQMMCASMVTFI